MKKNNLITMFILILILVFLVFIIRTLITIGIIGLMFSNSKVYVNTDISKYNDYMFSSAKEEYRNKWDMDESIFPKTIRNLDVRDYKMVYYDPWDKQFLSYLVIDYNDLDYYNEIKRLNSYESTSYLGYYGVEGFSNYNLLAMYADSYNGFVYAITNNSNRIIYVELIFCNYYYDLEYKKYIPLKYLPDGFDAEIDNLYMKNHELFD